MTKTLACLLLALAAAPAIAVDGVREINQTCAVSTGCFTGDVAGFPVTIDSAGSYRLTGNLALADANTHGILVNASSVSIDLNGFQISGVTSCNFSLPVGCTSTGSGRGVTALDALVEGLFVHGGTITGMGDDGVFVGNAGRVEEVRALGNGGDGIETAGISHVLRCNASRNGGRGIHASANGIVAGNVVVATGAGQPGISAGLYSTIEKNRITGAGGDGIAAGGGCTVRGNGVASSGGDGIEASYGVRVEENVVTSSTNFALNFTSSESGYAGNVFSLNGGTVTGPGINLGGNLCSGVVCP